MKIHYLFCLAFVTLFASCSLSEKPKFITLEKVSIDGSGLKNKVLKFKADAIFENINDVGGEILADSIFLYINDTKIGSLAPSRFDVPSKDTFAIPLQGEISASKLLGSKKNDLIGNILGVLSKRKVKLDIKGGMTFNKGVINYDYPISETKEITLF